MTGYEVKQYDQEEEQVDRRREYVPQSQRVLPFPGWLCITLCIRTALATVLLGFHGYFVTQAVGLCEKVRRGFLAWCPCFAERTPILERRGT